MTKPFMGLERTKTEANIRRKELLKKGIKLVVIKKISKQLRAKYNISSIYKYVVWVYE